MSDYYVIRRDDGAFVAVKGLQSSYTAKLQLARVWRSRDAAWRECCQNERVLAVGEVLPRAEDA